MTWGIYRYIYIAMGDKLAKYYVILDRCLAPFLNGLPDIFYFSKSLCIFKALRFPALQGPHIHGRLNHFTRLNPVCMLCTQCTCTQNGFLSMQINRRTK